MSGASDGLLGAVILGRGAKLATGNNTDGFTPRGLGLAEHAGKGKRGSDERTLCSTG